MREHNIFRAVLRPILLLVFSFLFFTVQTLAQSNGLHFNGQETVQDKRTSLDLSADGDVCLDGDFRLEFDLSFTPKYRDYYGYVFRIIDQNGYNIDLIYDQKSSNGQNFKLIIGNKFSKIAFNINKKLLFNHWSHFRMSYSRKDDKLSFYNGNQTYSEANVGLKSSRCFKVVFGVNHYKRFKTTDVPMMNIKDINIFENDALKFSWPLDEFNGSVALDRIQDKKASVENPAWINEMHSKWKMVQHLSIKGHPSIAFNQEKEIVYIVGPDAMYSCAIGEYILDTLNYDAKRDFTAGNQSVFDPASNRLYNVFIDQKKPTYFDFGNQKWDQKFTRPTRLTRYWHANKFISKADSSLYVFGGYGQLMYKDSISRYHLTSKSWQNVKLKGDVFKPRYLAALGATANGSTAFIIGGYGSETGQQMLNPESYYDLLKFDVGSQSLKKVYTLKSPDIDFAFSNSLIIDSASKNYYGLIFPTGKFNSRLQLIKGSLTSPTFQRIGNYIPYQFHDIHSYSDLFLAPVSRKLIAITMFTKENNETDVKIFTIEFPPNRLTKFSTRSHSLGYTVAAIFLLLIASGTAWFYSRKLRKKPLISTPLVLPEEPLLIPVEPHLTDDALPATVESINIPSASIFLFGNMQLFDRSGNDVTKSLSPLLKELFLLILTYSMRKEGGISGKKLDELLWFGKSEKIARNNRSVNIAKLKSILDKLEFCRLHKDSGYWSIDVDYNHVKVDYFEFLQIFKDHTESDRQRIARLVKIIDRGPLLLNIDYDWLDQLKSEVSHDVINLFLRFAASADAGSEPEVIIQIANHIFYFDPVNEDAMVYKCKALAHLGKHTLAKSSYEKFVKDYKAIYGVDFEKSFQSIIEA